MYETCKNHVPAIRTHDEGGIKRPGIENHEINTVRRTPHKFFNEGNARRITAQIQLHGLDHNPSPPGSPCSGRDLLLGSFASRFITVGDNNFSSSEVDK